MSQIIDQPGAPVSAGYCRSLSVLLWLALATGWLVSIFSVIEELCLQTACSDAAVYTFFGIGMGWFGIAYFSLTLLLLWLRSRNSVVNWALATLVFSGIGTELRLLWIQKYEIGGWCPLCVTICCALFTAAMLLVVENVHCEWSGVRRAKSLPGWLAVMSIMVAMGLAIAIAGIKALT